MVQFHRSDGLKLTSVYDEEDYDIIFGCIIGQQESVFDFINEDTVNMMNDIMEDSYDRRGIDFIPTKWYLLDGNEAECNLFVYTFFQRMGRDPEEDEKFTRQYTSDISIWEMQHFDDDN